MQQADDFILLPKINCLLTTKLQVASFRDKLVNILEHLAFKEPDIDFTFAKLFLLPLSGQKNSYCRFKLMIMLT